MKTINDSKGRLLAGTFILFATLAFLVSCQKMADPNLNTTGTGGTITPGANEVYIESSAFNPETITVAANTTITWTNKDAITHTVTSNTGVFSSGTLAKNATFSFKFTTPGTYPYHCTIHTAMTATVIVN
jgi:plastocyanin